MSLPDLNLLVALDVLLAEGNVARAAQRLGLSASAMSRTLARLRQVTGDPLLVRAGRGLVPTPHAQRLREQIGPVLQAAQALLQPAVLPDLARVERSFVLRCREGFVETFGAALLARVQAAAPGVQLRFLPKPDKDSRGLRDGSIDLETGVLGPEISPEILTQRLFDDPFVGVVHPGHPLAATPVDAAAYAAARHVVVSRRGLPQGVIDTVLASVGLQRRVATVVGGFAAALALARATELVATVPARHTQGLRRGLVSFPLPMVVPGITIALFWHPRLDADPVHRWLRGCVRAVCAEVLAGADDSPRLPAAGR